ncbi:MAG: S-layer homology domain-containing protein, partial [Acidimicrobiia bacterium]
MRRLVAGTVVLAVVGALGVLLPGSPARAAISFDDVAASNQFAKAIAWLASEGITKGCNPAEGNTRFCPDEYVTRGQMAAFLVRAFGYSDVGSVDFVDDDGSVFEADIER